MSDQDFDMREAGQRLRGRILELMAREGIATFIELSGKDTVSYVTLRHWWAGETKPRGFELQKVAKRLNTNLDDLDAAYEGRPRAFEAYQQNQELMARLRSLTRELHHLAVVQESLLPEAARRTLAGLREAEEQARSGAEEEDPVDEDPPSLPLPVPLDQRPPEWRQ